MGLVETKLAIIPGGGMNCSLSSLGLFDWAPDVGAGQSPVHGEGSVWVKEADARCLLLCTRQSPELLSLCVACGDRPALALCVITWSMLVSLLARSPYGITASLKFRSVHLNLCPLIPECQVHSQTLSVGGDGASAAAQLWPL